MVSASAQYFPIYRINTKEHLHRAAMLALHQQTIRQADSPLTKLRPEAVDIFVKFALSAVQPDSLFNITP